MGSLSDLFYPCLLSFQKQPRLGLWVRPWSSGTSVVPCTPSSHNQMQPCRPCTANPYVPPSTPLSQAKNFRPHPPPLPVHHHRPCLYQGIRAGLQPAFRADRAVLLASSMGDASSVHPLSLIPPGLLHRPSSSNWLSLAPLSHPSRALASAIFQFTSHSFPVLPPTFGFCSGNFFFLSLLGSSDTPPSPFLPPSLPAPPIIRLLVYITPRAGSLSLPGRQLRVRLSTEPDSPRHGSTTLLLSLTHLHAHTHLQQGSASLLPPEPCTTVAHTLYRTRLLYVIHRRSRNTFSLGGREGITILYITAGQPHHHTAPYPRSGSQ